ncbi:MAG: pseudouridine synthase, partial [Elusimicrobiaceae bacterium]
MKIEILYENSDFIAAYKPEGLLSIPGREGTEDSLLKILSAQAGRELYTVHRLDRPVSGAILFAKNEISHRELSLAFENRTI